jgi:large subunit ribosomal protein L23
MRNDEALRIVLRPFVTEKTFTMIERENKLSFIVKDDASRSLVKSAVETLYDVSVDSVNLARTISGKKAYVRLSPENSATDLASKLGLM